MSSNYHSFDELPLTLRVEELMPILGIGRNTVHISAERSSIFVWNGLNVSEDRSEHFG